MIKKAGLSLILKNIVILLAWGEIHEFEFELRSFEFELTSRMMATSDPNPIWKLTIMITAHLTLRAQTCAFFWGYSGIGTLGILDGICVLLGAIPFSESKLSTFHEGLQNRLKISYFGQNAFVTSLPPPTHTHTPLEKNSENLDSGLLS